MVDVLQVMPYGNAVDAWRLMRTVTLGVKVGSIHGQPYQFALDSSDGEAQKLTLRVMDDAVAKRLSDPAPPVWDGRGDYNKAMHAALHPRTQQPMPPDLERVCVYSVVGRRAWSALDILWGVRMNFYHSGVNSLGASTPHPLRLTVR